MTDACGPYNLGGSATSAAFPSGGLVLGVLAMGASPSWLMVPTWWRDYCTCEDSDRSMRLGYCWDYSPRVEALAAWAAGASTIPDPLLFAIFLPPCSGWFPWWSWLDLLAVGRLCLFRWWATPPSDFLQCFSWSMSLGGNRACCC
jgi:hypothetical protein